MYTAYEPHIITSSEVLRATLFSVVIIVSQRYQRIIDTYDTPNTNRAPHLLTDKVEHLFGNFVQASGSQVQRARCPCLLEELLQRGSRRARCSYFERRRTSTSSPPAPGAHGRDDAPSLSPVSSSSSRPSPCGCHCCVRDVTYPT